MLEPLRAPQKPTQSPSSVSTSLPTKGDHATYQPEYGQRFRRVDTAEIYTDSLNKYNTVITTYNIYLQHTTFNGF